MTYFHVLHSMQLFHCISIQYNYVFNHAILVFRQIYDALKNVNIIITEGFSKHFVAIEIQIYGKQLKLIMN